MRDVEIVLNHSVWGKCILRPGRRSQKENTAHPSIKHILHIVWYVCLLRMRVVYKVYENETALFIVTNFEKRAFANVQMLPFPQ